MEGIIYGSERQVVEMNMGDVQIHAHGYMDDPDLYTRIENPDGIIHQLQEQGLHASSRLYGFGLVAANLASAGIQLRGVDLAHESSVTKVHQHVAKGQWLSPEKRNHVVIGKKLATVLGVEIGDEVIFVGQSADGFMANDIFIIDGILKSVADTIDRAGVFMRAQDFRELMAIPEGAHEIVVLRSDRASDLDEATAKIQLQYPELEVRNWKQLMPFIAKMLESADAQMIVMLLITYVAVASIILNAMLMTVFERMHEFGIMKAIGVSPRQIVTLVYGETLVQTIVASIVATLGGWWVSDYFHLHGIDMSSFMHGSVSFGDVAFDPVWYTYVTAESLYTPVIFLFLIAMLAVIYPASKAALIKPIDAIYYR